MAYVIGILAIACKAVVFGSVFGLAFCCARDAYREVRSWLNEEDYL